MSNMFDLEDPLYKDWVRSALGLKYLKEGICDFVDRISKQHQENLLQSYIKDTGKHAVSCSECTSDNLLPHHPRHQCIQKFRSKCFCNNPCGRRKCPNNFCSRFYDKIVLCHEDANPLWINTDLERWYMDHWEMAKCFLETTGYKDKGSAVDTDVAGLLSIMLNNLEFRNHLNCIDNVVKVREIRNDIMHSNSFQLARGSLHQYIDQMILVLQDSKVLINDVAAQIAVAKLENIKRDQIYISKEDAFEMRRHALKAIIDGKEELEKATEDMIQQMETRGRETNDSLNGQNKRLLEEQKKGTEEITQNIIQAKSLNNDVMSGEYRLTEDEKGLQKYLLDLYQSDHVHIPLSPLSTKDTINVEEIYVPLKANIIYGNVNESVAKLTDLFHHGNACFHTVYLTGDAGIGKSTFCRKLISLWCTSRQISGEKPYIYIPVFDFETETSTENDHLQNDDMDNTSFEFDLFNDSDTSSIEDNDSKFNHDEDLNIDITQQIPLYDNDNGDAFTSTPLFKEDYRSDEDDVAIKKFDFLFFISLRDTRQEGTIEDMIKEQLLFQKSSLVECFNGIVDRIPHKCLVILDGLDEWKPPSPLPTQPTVTKGLPISSVSGRYMKLLTSRKWKYETVNPRTKEDESEVRLRGIGEKSSRELIKKLLKAGGGRNEIDQVLAFETAVSCSETYDLVSIPLLVNLLFCLWQTNFKLESSKTEIYSSVINIMLHLATGRDDLKIPTDISNLKLPDIFEAYCHVKKHINLLHSLSKFAFYALFKEPYGSAVVFSVFDIESEGLGSEQIRQCLQIGFLTQKSISSRCTLIPKMLLSFIHKSFQEFFAALYISVGDDDRDEIRNIISRRLVKSNSLMNMKTVLYFLADFRKDLFLEILEQLVSQSRMNTEITYHNRVLTLKLKDEDACLTEVFLRGNPKTVDIESTNFGVDGFRFTHQNNQLQFVELKCVSLTHRAFKTMLESIPKSEDGIEVVLECIGWVNEHLEEKNFILTVEIKNTKNLKIKFTNLTKVICKLPPNIQSVELKESNMTDVGLTMMLNSVSDTNEEFEMTINCVNFRSSSYAHCLTECSLLTMAINPEINERVTSGSISICTKNMSNRATCNGPQNYQWRELRIRDLSDVSTISTKFDLIRLVNVKITTTDIKELLYKELIENDMEKFMNLRKGITHTLQMNTNVQSISHRLFPRYHEYGNMLFFSTTIDFCLHLFSNITNVVIITCLKCSQEQECSHRIKSEDMSYFLTDAPELKYIKLNVVLANSRSEVTGLLRDIGCFGHILTLTITCDAMKIMNEGEILNHIKSNLKAIDVHCGHSYIRINLNRLRRNGIDFIISFSNLLQAFKMNKEFLSELSNQYITLILKSPSLVIEIQHTNLFARSQSSYDDFEQMSTSLLIKPYILTKEFQNLKYCIRSWQKKMNVR